MNCSPWTRECNENFDRERGDAVVMLHREDFLGSERTLGAFQVEQVLAKKFQSLELCNAPQRPLD